MTRRNTYATIIRKAEADAKASPPNVADWPTESLRGAIESISAMLIGPGVDAYERLMLNSERRAIREELARREAAP